MHPDDHPTVQESRMLFASFLELFTREIAYTGQEEQEAAALGSLEERDA